MAQLGPPRFVPYGAYSAPARCRRVVTPPEERRCRGISRSLRRACFDGGHERRGDGWRYYRAARLRGLWARRLGKRRGAVARKESFAAIEAAVLSTTEAET